MNETLTFEQYVDAMHQSVANEYKRYLRRNDPPKKGAVVLYPLRDGTGLEKYHALTVLGVTTDNEFQHDGWGEDERYILLQGPHNIRYVSDMSCWWKEIIIVSE